MLTGNWLSQTCGQIERDFKVVITDYARQFILQTVVALQVDPHPAWRHLAAPSDDEIRELIRERLTQLARIVSGRDPPVITYFHVLHYVETSFRAWPVAKD